MQALHTTLGNCDASPTGEEGGELWNKYRPPMMRQPPTLIVLEASEGRRILGPNDGKAVDFGSFGVRFMVWS